MNTQGNKLIIEASLWEELILDLKSRGNNERESGAFLLGDSKTGTITSYICYDDLDPNCLDKGYINFNGTGYIELWSRCEEEKMSVIADVHTHPGKRTSQSLLDINNPMIFKVGHIALIVPYYATNPKQIKSFEGLGIYEYKGNFKWSQMKIQSAIKLIKK